MGKKEDDHNRGQSDGAKAANFFDLFVEDTNPFGSDEYKQGYRHGYQNRPQKDLFEWPKDDKPKEEKTKPELEETKAETRSNNDDYYDDYYPTRSRRRSPPPPPPKITYDWYSVNEGGYTKTSYEFDSDEEKQAFLDERERLERLIFKDDPEHWHQKAIEQGKQDRIRKDIEALESEDPVEIIKLLIRKALLG